MLVICLKDFKGKLDIFMMIENAIFVGITNGLR